jgi:MFS family permease
MKKIILLPTLLLGWLFILYEYAIRLSDSVIIDRLMQSLQIGPGRIGVLSSAYYLPYVLMQIPAGLLIDRYGLRRSWAAALFAIAVGSLLFAYSHTATMASFARVLMGVGSSFAWVGTVGVIYRLTGEKNSALLIGVSMSLCMLGALLGQAPWLYLTNILQEWRTPYVYAAIIGAVLFVLILFFGNKECKKMSVKHDMASILKSIVPLLKSKAFWLLVAYLTAISLPQNAFTALWAVEFLKRSYHLQEQTAATLMSLIWLGGLLGAPAIGFVSDRLHTQRNFLIGVGVLTLVLMLVVIFIQPHSKLLLAITLFIIGFITNASVVVYALAAKMASNISTSSIIGVANMVNMGGAAIVQMITGGVLSLTMTQGNIGNFYWALLIIPILLFASIVSLFMLKSSARIGE